MKKSFCFTLLILLLAGIAYAKDYEVKKKAGEYDVQVSIDRNPPVVGVNNATITLKDKAGKNVTAAKVTLDYSMPPMPGMPAMNYKADTELKGNEYRTKMDLSMAGTWNIVVKIDRAGKKQKVKFSINAQ
ncbi:MAG: FixH family protein [Thermodesulfovibrionales bacterium]